MRYGVDPEATKGAFAAIHDTAAELLAQDGLSETMQHGLELIVLLTRYKRDVRQSGISDSLSESAT